MQIIFIKSEHRLFLSFQLCYKETNMYMYLRLAEPLNQMLIYEYPLILNKLKDKAKFRVQNTLEYKLNSYVTGTQIKN